jgi:hypothetical protein
MRQLGATCAGISKPATGRRTFAARQSTEQYQSYTWAIASPSISMVQVT